MRRYLTKMWHWVGLLSGIVGLIVLINLVDAKAVAAALTVVVAFTVPNLDPRDADTPSGDDD